MLGRCLALVAVFFGLLVVPVSTAAACSCATSTTSQQVQEADVVFLGTITDRDDATDGTQARFVSYTVTVDRVFKGSVAATTYIQSATDGASCGLESIVIGRKHLIFATTNGTHGLDSDLCGGTTAADPRVTNEAQSILGAGYPAVSAVDAPSGATLPAIAGAAKPAVPFEPMTVLLRVVGGLVGLIVIAVIVAVVREERRGNGPRTA